MVVCSPGAPLAVENVLAGQPCKYQGTVVALSCCHPLLSPPVPFSSKSWPDVSSRL